MNSVERALHITEKGTHLKRNVNYCVIFMTRKVTTRRQAGAAMDDQSEISLAHVIGVQYLGGVRRKGSYCITILE